MDAIVFVARTSCPWTMIPRQLSASSSVHDRCQQWGADGVFLRRRRASVLDCDALTGVRRLWQAADGVMTAAPLGEKRPDQTQPRHGGSHTAPADRRQRHPARRSR
ncbi:transposase [Roseiflexus sp.]|uniref:transposase n=1 Tax=Roseiflexus sp. TaxID=2562120 RepID=UPI00398B702F